MDTDTMMEIPAASGKTIWLNAISNKGESIGNLRLKCCIIKGANVLTRIIYPIIDCYQKSINHIYVNKGIRVPIGAKFYWQPINLKHEVYKGEFYMSYNLSI